MISKVLFFLTLDTNTVLVFFFKRPTIPFGLALRVSGISVKSPLECMESLAEHWVSWLWGAGHLSFCFRFFSKKNVLQIIGFTFLSLLGLIFGEGGTS